MARRTTSESTESFEHGDGEAVSSPAPRRRRRVTAAAAAPAQAPVAEQPGSAGSSETVTISGLEEPGVQQAPAAPVAEPVPPRRRRKVVAASAAPEEAPAAEARVAVETDDPDEPGVTEGASSGEAAQEDLEDQVEGSAEIDETDDEEADQPHEGDEPAGTNLDEEEDLQVPRLPAASLLFQAPDPSRARRRRRVTAASAAPQEAPTASRHQGAKDGTDEEDADARTGAQGHDEDAESESSRADRSGGRGRRRRRAAAGTGAPQESREDSALDKTDAEVSEADGPDGADEAQAESSEDGREGGVRRKRRRGGRGRRSRSRGEDSTRTDADDESPAVEDDGADEAPSRESSSDAATEIATSAVSGSRRRRRRSRTRSEGGDLRDEVTALKGSTRLEAKRQRRREGRAAGRRRPIVTEAEFLARRESVDRQMIVRESDGLNQIAVLEDGLLVEHYVSRHTQTSMVGNVYVGRVQNVLPSMEAAFVDLGKGRNAVLYAGEVNWDAAGLEGRPRRIEDALSSGDTVLVQVTKDPIGHKGARLTSQITLAGRYLVLVPGGTMTGISRKLPDTERSRLKKILKRIVPDSAGVIVRTAAEGATQEQLTADVERLVAQWEAIDKKASSVMKGSGKAPVLLKGEPELAVRVIRDVFNEDFRKLIVSGDNTWSTISQYIDEVSPDLSERLEHWVGPEDVFAAHRVDEQLAKGFDRKVWLPSGGTLVIDRTEAMTVIDVNTGRFTGAGGTLEETVTRNNLEAAEEIVRQLRLRDIGGMVVIDFVDMVLESNRDLVLRRLVECLGRDRTRHQVTEVTSLGLVQMTRKRVGQGLVEAFSTTCEHCKGRGFIVHDEPVENQQIDMSASASRGGGRSRGRKNREEQATGGGKKETKKDSQETKGSKSSKGSGRGKASAGRDVAASPESGVDDEARAAVRGALAQIAAAAEQAHKDSQQEGQDPHEGQGAVEVAEAGVSDTADAATQTAENGQSSDGQEVSDSPAEDKPVKTRSRKAADKKSVKKTGEKKGDKADKKLGRKTGKKAEKKAATTSEDPAEPQPGEASAEPVEEKPVRRTRRRATAKSAAPAPENSSDAPEASA